MREQFILTEDSLYRTWETRENPVNYYGRVLSWDEPNDKYIPVICGHGGSMWLCAGCAERILKSPTQASALRVDSAEDSTPKKGTVI